MTLVGLAVAAAVGAVVRFRLGVFGWRGTLAVNLAGSFVLGLLVARQDDSSDVLMVLGTGFCGALTTYGTFALEASTGPPRARLVVVLTNLGGCVAAAAAGYALG